MVYIKLSRLRKQLRRAHREAQSWNTVGMQFGLSGGMAYRIAMQDYEPKEPAIRSRLGLPSLLLAPACERCGQVHVTRRCIRLARVYRQLIDIPVAELRRMIEKREEF